MLPIHINSIVLTFDYNLKTLHTIYNIYRVYQKCHGNRPPAIEVIECNTVATRDDFNMNPWVLLSDKPSVP